MPDIPRNAESRRELTPANCPLNPTHTSWGIRVYAQVRTHTHSHTRTCVHAPMHTEAAAWVCMPRAAVVLIFSIIYCGVTSGASVRVFLERYNWQRPIMNVGGTIS